jgi:phosphate-selective porin OprO and OprP
MALAYFCPWEGTGNGWLDKRMTGSMRTFFIFLVISICSESASYAQRSTDTLNAQAVDVRYGSKGFEFRTRDNLFSLQLQSRLQFRYVTPNDQNPLTFDDFDVDERQMFKINRARLKVGGHGFQPWLKYYWEYELAQGNLLDFRIMVEKWPWFNIKVGQWKVEYNRERVISSGKQQMADRSIINRPFTIDRQQGLSVYGRLRGKGAADVSYWLAALTGNGRGAVTSEEAELMYVGRLQWNFTGQELEMTGSDTEYQRRGRGTVALAAATNRSPYTRFSQSGGGSLEMFEAADTSRYRVQQWMIETAYMYRGFSWQSEFHWKQVNDMAFNRSASLRGSYWQAGYFFHYLWKRIPRPLEMAFRYAAYRPDLKVPQNLQQEYTLAANWFFKEHQNKLTAELSWFTFEDQLLRQADDLRFRLQWEISF